jgi:hypothetical protein
MKIKLENKEIQLTELCFNYLFPSLVRFCLSKQISIEWKNDTILIPKKDQGEFNKMLEEVLQQLLVECYREPTHKERSKHSTRYQKVEFRGDIYVLNYRTDIVGIIGYALDYLISETKLGNIS